MDYGYVQPYMSLLGLVSIIITLLFVGLAWWNFKETRRMIGSATEGFNNFLNSEAAKNIAVGMEKIRLAGEVRAEFLKHTHNREGKVEI